VEGVPTDYLLAHHQLLQEFSNASFWPKHVLVEYTWEHSPIVNAMGGLYLLFTTGKYPRDTSSIFPTTQLELTELGYSWTSWGKGKGIGTCRASHLSYYVDGERRAGRGEKLDRELAF
jgi:hypothetical protein